MSLTKKARTWMATCVRPIRCDDGMYQIQQATLADLHLQTHGLSWLYILNDITIGDENKFSSRLPQKPLALG